MGKPDLLLKKQSAKDKYLTEYYVRERKAQHYYNTTPNVTPDYLKNNLHIKSCVCGYREIFTYQPKRTTFRNYTPKILNQEVNMGMWM